MGSRVPLKVLFVVPYAPTRIRTRPFHLIQALAADGHQVTVATLWSNDEERATVEQLGHVAANVLAEPHPTSRALWNCLRARPGPDPLQAHYSWSPRLARRIGRAVEETVFACPAGDTTQSAKACASAVLT